MMDNRTAIVTGGSRGIGRATCFALAQRGAHVFACGRDESALQQVCDQSKKLELNGTIEPIVLDVTNKSAIDTFVEHVGESAGKIDILVNNAGITRDGLLMNMEDDQFEDVLTTNLRSVFWMCRAASRLMIRKRYGRIVNVGSISGVMGNAGQTNYAASKAGLIGFSKSVAKELAKRNITCNVVAPGFIETDMTAALPEKVSEGAKQHIPMARFGKPEEVSAVIAFLASETASYVTGQVVVIDGGLHM